MTAFATAADMITRYDVRLLGDLCADDGSRVTEAALKSTTSPNPIMAAALDSASGKVKAAVLRAGRYTVMQLEALTGESQAYLVDLTCQIAFWMLWRRRPYSEAYDSQLKNAKEAYDESLESLRTGDEIFEVDVVIEAGKPKIETVTRVESKDFNLAVDQARGGNFYPRRRTYRDR